MYKVIVTLVVLALISIGFFIGSIQHNTAQQLEKEPSSIILPFVPCDPKDGDKMTNACWKRKKKDQETAPAPPVKVLPMVEQGYYL